MNVINQRVTKPKRERFKMKQMLMHTWRLPAGTLNDPKGKSDNLIVSWTTPSRQGSQHPINNQQSWTNSRQSTQKQVGGIQMHVAPTEMVKQVETIWERNSTNVSCTVTGISSTCATASHVIQRVDNIWYQNRAMLMGSSSGWGLLNWQLITEYSGVIGITMMDNQGYAVWRLKLHSKLGRIRLGYTEICKAMERKLSE